MPILKESSAELRRRLLELFPAVNLRAFFKKSGLKEGLASAIAKSADPVNLAHIAQFVDTTMTFCKQHVYVFEHDGDLVLPEDFSGAERVASAPDHALYIAKRHYEVVKLDPPQNSSMDFLWPIRLELTKKYLLVRFVVLEKDLSAYFDRQIMVRSKAPSEEAMTGSLLSDGNIYAADLNKGIKALWAKDLIDATRLRFDMPDSADSKSMNGAKQLKKTNPGVYADVRLRPLRMCTFVGHGPHTAVGNFSVSPTEGFIGFTRYSKDGSSGDELIRQILASN
ncbi:hypothetical protein [Granulicella mallensis]|uniref:Uncharacterized protein n=1 Tax=Granulicella mallensis TaxID=940614 RepID=A0A7W7ZPW1_9BACT|nr:hypothetical protein [Granulicella mallensis]MBB5063945.1 hypothetical protein [Granulicella mallensis]